METATWWVSDIFFAFNDFSHLSEVYILKIVTKSSILMKVLIWGFLAPWFAEIFELFTLWLGNQKISQIEILSHLVTSTVNQILGAKSSKDHNSG